MHFIALVITAVLLLPFPAAAQRGQQMIDFFLQGLQGFQQLEQQQRQQQQLQHAHQVYVGYWQACHGGHIASCDEALSYPFIAERDRQVLFNRRAQLVALQVEAQERARRERAEAEGKQQAQALWYACHGGDISACDRSLIHPHVTFEDRQPLGRQRSRLVALQQEAEAQQRQRQIAAERERERARQAEQQRAVAQQPIYQALYQRIQRTTLGELLAWPPTPLSASAVGGISLLSLSLVLLAWRARSNVEPIASRTTSPSLDAALIALGEQQAPSSAAVPPPLPAEPRSAIVTPASRDTAGAIAALELALAYIEEVRAAPRPAIDDTDTRKRQLNTLALAAKQLDLAQRLDPDAVLETELEGVPLGFTVNELKSSALVLEGITHQVYDVKRALPALIAATELNPHNAHAFYILGLMQAANRSKSKAVAAFASAAALEPKNIDYRKELNRTQNMSEAEILAYHATRTGEKVVDGAVFTANIFIGLWNVFAITWNVLTFPLRLFFRILRVLRLHP